MAASAIVHTALAQVNRMRSGLGALRLTLEVRHDMPGWQQAAVTLFSIALGLLLSGLVLVCIGVDARELIRTFFVENFTIIDNLKSVMMQTARLILVGLAAAVAFKVRFWNLGIEGQMIWGGIGATAVSIYRIGPAGGRLALMLMAALVASALWGLIALGLKRRYAANEIIVTLLLNYVAMNFLFHLLFGAWIDPTDSSRTRSSISPPSACRASRAGSVPISLWHWLRWSGCGG